MATTSDSPTASVMTATTTIETNLPIAAYLRTGGADW
jgi:hypothetical protein